jgi:hypothetical protein
MRGTADRSVYLFDGRVVEETSTSGAATS